MAETVPNDATGNNDINDTNEINEISGINELNDINVICYSTNTLYESRLRNLYVNFRCS